MATAAHATKPNGNGVRKGESAESEPKWKKLGEYKVIEDIAEGSFGVVRLAVHTLTGHHVAMKFIKKNIIQRANHKGRVRKEVEYMRLLSRHPHIVKLYEVINTKTDIVLVLEYAKSDMLNVLSERGRLREPVARRYFQQMISGVAYSHRLGVAHRDLKPENLLLDSEDNVKIIDFGLSNALGDGEFLDTNCGTVHYAAPEVVSGRLYTGPDVDVWSSGVILYVMLTGQLPFEHGGVDDNKYIIAQIRQGQYRIPNYVSSSAANLIKRMLTVDPFKRITIEEIFEHPWFKPGLPAYLAPLPSAPGPVIGTLSSLVDDGPQKREYEIVQGIGRVHDELVDELAATLELPKQAIWSAFRKEGANSVKVAYCILRDKKAAGGNFAKLAEKERESQVSQLSALEPTLLLSSTIPPILAPLTKINPAAPPKNVNSVLEEALQVVAEEDDSDYDSELDLDLQDRRNSKNNFAVLDSSLPSPVQSNQEQGPQPHHLTSYISALRSSSAAPEKKRVKRQWRFGIRSRSPPMQVMLSIYQTLAMLGMEWREKKGIWGSRGASHRYRRDVSPKEAQSIFHVETRCRIKDTVVLMDLQLYQVDSINYVVDFRSAGHYKASTHPRAAKYDRLPPPDADPEPSPQNSRPPLNRTDSDRTNEKDHPISTPFLFVEVAAKLIVELAAGEKEPEP